MHGRHEEAVRGTSLPTPGLSGAEGRHPLKLTLIGTAVLLLQSSLVVDIGAPARPEHLRYQRSVVSAATGMTCASLDATVLGHTASAAHSDLRVFGRLSPGSSAEIEVPYTVTESGPEPVADTAASPEHVTASGNQLSFDLRMPARPYSEVRLGINLKNFVASAAAEGRDRNGSRKDLGTVPIFDLSAAHLGRWTSLLLAESSWPVLHLTLTVRSPEGKPLDALSPGLILGAEVPPSRERGTRYVPTISTDLIDQRGFLSVAMLRVPAHVPVERVAFTFDPGFTANFARDVTVSARADRAPITDTEALDAGSIEHVSLPSGDPRLVPISLKEDALDATMGANLALPATVLVAINNDGRAPLPIRSVILEMRERKLCFFADREGTYTLRYGDPALSAPGYSESALAVPTQPFEAQLGPETVNPQFQARPETRSYLKRHPELFWLAVLLCGGMMGGSALHHVQHRRI